MKWCDESGKWAGKEPGVYGNPWGWTNYTSCFRIAYDDVLVRQLLCTYIALSNSMKIRSSWCVHQSEERGHGKKLRALFYLEEVTILRCSVTKDSHKSLKDDSVSGIGSSSKTATHPSNTSKSHNLPKHM